MSLSFLQCLLRKVMAIALIGVFPLSLCAQDAQTAAQPQAAPSSQAQGPKPGGSGLLLGCVRSDRGGRSGSADVHSLGHHPLAGDVHAAFLDLAWDR